MKEHCENCKWFGGYTGKVGIAEAKYRCNDPKPHCKYEHYSPEVTCGHYREKNMWLTKEQIKERAVTLEGAFDVSIEKYTQFLSVPIYDFKEKIACGKINTTSEYCGLCQYFKKRVIDNCDGCPLKDSRSETCCSEWRTINHNLTFGGLNHADIKRLIDRLKRERNKLFGDEMSKEEAYKILQAEWVKLYKVEVGDTVKVLRTAKTYELGWDNGWSSRYSSNKGMDKSVGQTRTVKYISHDIKLDDGYGYPFFVLEFVKKAEPKIEIDVKINGVTGKLKDISAETLLKLRNIT